MQAPIIKIAVVDDHTIVRDGICAILRAEEDFQIVGEAGDGQEAVDLVARVQPDVVLMDLNMPGLSGLDACRVMTERHPAVAVIILTAFLDSEMVFRCIQAGAKGYVIKDVERTDLKRKIRAAARGEGVLDEKSVSPVMDYVRKGMKEPAHVTEREIAILKLIAEGLTNKEIGQQLYLSEATIKDQLRKIMDKLGVEHRISAVIRASKDGLI